MTPVLSDLIAWLQATPPSVAIRESDWIFPAIESVHVIAFVFVLGSIGVVDFRLLGLVWRNRRAEDLIAELLPVTWTAFALAAFAGGLLFLGKPVTYTANAFFLIKMALLVLAGGNMLVFHHFVHERLARLAPGEPHLLSARASGLASLMLWIGVVACGRWIGFTAI